MALKLKKTSKNKTIRKGVVVGVSMPKETKVQLEKIQKKFGFSTYSATIQYLINSYSENETKMSQAMKLAEIMTDPNYKEILTNAKKD